MSAIDIVILLVLVCAVAYGWVKGFISQLAAVGGVVVGIILCRVMGEVVASWIGGFHAEASETTRFVDSAMANALLLALGCVGVKLGARVVKTVSHALMLGVFDRMAGAVFALFAWMLALSVALNVWLCLKPESEIVADSRLNDGRAVKLIMEMAPDVLGGVSPAQLFEGD